jgi:hypothetical protein
MPKVEVRKFATVVEEIFHEGGPVAAKPFRQGACLAVIRNPFAGRYEPDIQPFMKDLEPLGAEMAKRLISALGVKPKEIEAYGKGAIVGVAGELEHAALWHQPSGWGIREAMGGAKAIVPSTVKVAAAGARIDIPLHHANAAYVRSHFDAVEFCVPDGPKPDEIVYIVGLSTGGRPHPRVGGLRADEIKLWDGQR